VQASRHLRHALAHELDCSPDSVALEPVPGGCINRAFRVDRPGSPPGFLKWQEGPGGSCFSAEADGLDALRRVPEIRVPEVWALDDSGALPWLLLEFVAAGPATGEYWERLGRGVAAVHAPRSEPAGWNTDNCIGTLPQANSPRSAWSIFYRDLRLLPQLELAFASGALRPRGEDWQALLDLVDPLLRSDTESMSLLHGDLWSGNVFPDRSGQPVLIDPAVYMGHREVDLAMADLFGGFAAGFFSAYQETLPVPAEYGRVRRNLYQLYPLLVHVNLFGGAYADQALTAAQRVLRAG